jgi:hypothetical protein
VGWFAAVPGASSTARDVRLNALLMQVTKAAAFVTVTTVGCADDTVPCVAPDSGIVNRKAS